MRKQLIAFLAAFVITGIVALSMLVVGVNAAINPNGVAVSNSPAQAALQEFNDLFDRPGTDRPTSEPDQPVSGA